MNNGRSQSLAEPKEKNGKEEGIDIDELRELSRIENEVRRRLQDILSAAGLSSDGVAKEVLYWLPADFLEWYRQLFLRALQLNQQQGKGESNQKKADLGKALVDEKEYKGKRIGSGAGAKKPSRSNGGAWIIRDEEALKLLGEVNKELVMMPYDQLQGRVKFVRKVGEIVERAMEGKRNGEGKKRRVCGDCAKLMAGEWRRCPFHE